MDSNDVRMCEIINGFLMRGGSGLNREVLQAMAMNVSGATGISADRCAEIMLVEYAVKALDLEANKALSAES